MNRKGFTLIELLAVITILVILSLIIIPVVDTNIKRSKQDMYNIQIDNIRMAGVNYFTNNMSMRPDRGEHCSISLDFLVEEDYMSDDVVNPKTGESFNNLYVQIQNNGTEKDSYIYLVCPDESGCLETLTSCSGAL